MATDTIKAIRVHAYGGPDQLVLEQVARPQPQEQEVLIRVHSAGVNPVDWKMRQGWLKDFMPVQFPYIPGLDLAGVIEEAGPGVTALKIGQEVYGETTHSSRSLVPRKMLDTTRAIAARSHKATKLESRAIRKVWLFREYSVTK